MKYLGIFLMVLFETVLYGNMATAQDIIAHRGASYNAPENTVTAVRLGYEEGADAVEIDIHLSKDNRVMVNHDKDTKRTAGRNLTIRETHSSELRKLDVGKWKDKKFKGEKMPFLEEVLAEVPENKTLVIEIKSQEEIIPFLKEVIKESGIEERLIIISFNKNAIIKAKEQLPEIPSFWLLHTFKDYSLEEAIDIVKKHQLNGLDVHYPLITAEFMQKMNNAGLEVYAYTVNDATVARKLKEMQIKGITTDRPHWLREQIK